MREPPWWYQERPGGTARLLAPAAWIVEAVGRRRMAHARAYRARLPVICIGNFTVCGAGKTPLAILIADMLKAQGARPAFLSRGYRGSLTGPHRVEPAQDSAREVGDEPLLLARTAPTWISADRAAGARAIEAGDATAIVMDDGLQNPGLAKTLSLAVVDGERGLGNGRVMPAGPLRAELERQLASVDAILINGEADRANASLARLKSRFGGPILHASVRPRGATDWLAGRPFVAYTGIGVPHRFFRSAERAGAILRARIAFPDHHDFGDPDARRLLALAEEHGAGLLTTEKDRVRMLNRPGLLAELADRSECLAIAAEMADGDHARLAALVELAVRRVG